MTKLISNTIKKLKVNSIQKAVYIENMEKYVEKTIELTIQVEEIKEIKEDIYELNKLKGENKELKNEIDAMKQLNKEEMNNLRTEMFSMIQELGYKNELNDRVKKGEITSDEARAEYQGFEKPKSK